MRSKVVVIGATGFLGRQIASAESDKYEIFGTTRSEKNVEGQLIKLRELEDFLVQNKGRLKAIVNCAVLYTGSEDEMHQTNVELPKYLLQLCQEYDVPQLVLFDSFYSFTLDRYNHLTTYTENKVHLRNEISRTAKDEVHVNWIVLGHIFGEFDRESKFVPSTIVDLLSHRKLDMTNGEQLRDFTYVGDAVASLMKSLCLELNSGGGMSMFYLGSGESRSVRYFVEKAVECSGSKSKINFGALKYRQNEIMKPFVGDEYIPPMQYVVKYGFEKGLRRTIEYYRDVKRTNK